MYVDSATEEHVSGLTEELQEILSESLIQDYQTDHPNVKKARLIRAEIESLGFYVTIDWSITQIESASPEQNVRVTVFAPRDGLSGDLLEIYENWHAEAKKRFEKIKNPSS